MRNIIRDAIKVIREPRVRFSIIFSLGLFNKMDDEKYLKKKYKARLGKQLHLNPPQTFNEKLQWLKLHDRKPEYSIYVDKYKVREYIRKTLGEDYLIPLIGVYNAPDEIDFEQLPNQFVLKCNHNSGRGMIICRDKSMLDYNKAIKTLYRGFNEDFYLSNREWPYRDVQRKIICEKYMTNDERADMIGKSKGLIDYKFYCFNGQPKYLYVSQGLENHSIAKVSFLTLDWKIAPFGRLDYRTFDEVPPKPEKYDEMLEIAKKLSKDIPFLRVDLYEINGHVYFGELTFSPCGGFMPFDPQQADFDLGKELHLPNYNQ